MSSNQLSPVQNSVIVSSLSQLDMVVAELMQISAKFQDLDLMPRTSDEIDALSGVVRRASQDIMIETRLLESNLSDAHKHLKKALKKKSP